jgi:hypothetical protein
MNDLSGRASPDLMHQQIAVAYAIRGRAACAAWRRQAVIRNPTVAQVDPEVMVWPKVAAVDLYAPDLGSGASGGLGDGQAFQPGIVQALVTVQVIVSWICGETEHLRRKQGLDFSQILKIALCVPAAARMMRDVFHLGLIVAVRVGHSSQGHEGSGGAMHWVGSPPICSAAIAHMHCSMEPTLHASSVSM